MQYDFFAPQRIVFGWGRRVEVGELARDLGQRAFLISGSRTLEANGELAAVINACHQAGVDCQHVATITHEPIVADVDSAVAELQQLEATANDVLIAVGGGSAIDLAKACSAMLTNSDGDSVQDYLEGVGRGLKVAAAPLPLLAIPTTAGTGTEATKNAVISNFDPPFKKSLRSNLMVPKIVLVDPELGASMPPSTTAYTGMDAITQLIESYISARAKPIPQALCAHGLELAIPAIAAAVEEGTQREARERMAHAALLSGMAVANSGLGFAHGVAPALGVHLNVPHGLACAVMLPTALRVNRDVRLAEIAQLGRLFA
ncbi:MAG: alcohol dehydrogenase, partial [Planctomycetaceae bacterium]|nr:alcohol dehydrogenase [Planctomycetaceae bacterium]